MSIHVMSAASSAIAEAATSIQPDPMVQRHGDSPVLLIHADEKRPVLPGTHEDAPLVEERPGPEHPALLYGRVGPEQCADAVREFLSCGIHLGSVYACPARSIDRSSFFRSCTSSRRRPASSNFNSAAAASI